MVSLEGRAYEVDASLVGETVTLRYDPSKPGRPLQVVHGGKSWTAKLVDLYQNCFVKRDRPSQTLAPREPEPAAPTVERPLPAQPLRLSALSEKEGR